MRAVVFSSPGELSVTTVSDPTAGPRDVIVRVAAVGMCGTDIHVFEGDYLGGKFPMVPGHEATGTIVEVGSEVDILRVGDRVAIDPTLTCGECEYCMTGRPNLCRNWNSLGVIRSFGASAEFVAVPARNVYVLRDDVDLFEATMIEPLSCVIRGLDLQPRRIGDHYLVYGAGTMGLLMAQMAVRAGAASVSVVDTNASRLAIAAEVGVELRASKANELDRHEWDVVVDCTGVIPAMEDAMTRVKPGGVFQQFGVAPVGAKARYVPLQITKDEITILGSMAARHSFGRAVDMFSAGAINAAPLFSHSFALDGYEDAMQMFRAGTGRKLQIRPQDDRNREI
jgi:2-desacetyl-2-hydroxyethyl bacteriochlorophyllide A dehydrogenase